MPVSLIQLVRLAEEVMMPARFDDYCPNGLQVEGRPWVAKLVSGVTASLAFLEAAVTDGADAVLVHHGYFWRNEDPCIVGMKFRRLKLLLGSELSLLAYHLPLDAHLQLGNNVQLAEKLGFEVEGPLNDQNIGCFGRLRKPVTGAGLASRIERQLRRKPFHIPGKVATVERIAWCTGAAQHAIDEAYALGVDAFLTGEVSEQTVHQARELGIHFYAAGHHATERYGAQALGSYLAQELGIAHRFIDIDNPV